MMRPLRLVLAFVIGVPIGAPIAFVQAIGCQQKPPCQGCGCKGGTGYRGPNGRCVGFREFVKACGSPPEAQCVFENAPGTGENRDCALARPAPKNPPAPSSEPEKSGR